MFIGITQVANCGGNAMKKKNWKKKIEDATKEIGTYKPSFDAVIDTLADILENRDSALKEFKDEGSHTIVEHYNKAGNLYKEQNPILRLVNDLNRDALAYWRDLGLTPAGLKKINESALKKKKVESALEYALKSLSGKEEV